MRRPGAESGAAFASSLIFLICGALITLVLLEVSVYYSGPVKFTMLQVEFDLTPPSVSSIDAEIKLHGKFQSNFMFFDLRLIKLPI